MKYREAAVAGRFYTADSKEMRQQMADYFSAPATDVIAPKALIVPHAGYFYSGEVAARAYALIRSMGSTFSRVVLLGPSHHVALEGCAVPDSDYFLTPLGKIAIDSVGRELLLSREWVIESELVHRDEHALEVQLPFLQYCLNDFVLLPVVVGRTSPEQVSELLSLVAGPETLIVVSSDLSHYHPYDKANRIDSATVNQILAMTPTIHGEQACGCYSVNGLLDYARKQGWKISCISAMNSGDVMARHHHQAPDRTEGVVGYASFALY